MELLFRPLAGDLSFSEGESNSKSLLETGSSRLLAAYPGFALKTERGGSAPSRPCKLGLDLSNFAKGLILLSCGSSLILSPDSLLGSRNYSP